MSINIVFWLGSDRPSGLFLFMPVALLADIDCNLPIADIDCNLPIADIDGNLPIADIAATYR